MSETQETPRVFCDEPELMDSIRESIAETPEEKRKRIESYFTPNPKEEE